MINEIISVRLRHRLRFLPGRCRQWLARYADRRANDATIGRFQLPACLFLMATPYLVVGSIAAARFYAYRRALSETRGNGSRSTADRAISLESGGKSQDE